MFQTKLDPAGGVWSWGQASTLVKIAVVAEIFLEMLRLVQAVCYGMLQHDYDYDGEIYNYNIYIYNYIVYIYIYIYTPSGKHTKSY